MRIQNQQQERLECDEGFPSPTDLSEHTIKKHTQIKCIKCTFVTETPSTMELHIKSKHQIQCDQCESTFTSERDINSLIFPWTDGKFKLPTMSRFYYPGLGRSIYFHPVQDYFYPGMVGSLNFQPFQGLIL